MQYIDGLSENQIKKLIFERLKELKIQYDLLRIDIIDGSRILLSGEVYSHLVQEEIKQAILDIVEVEIIDKLIIVQDLYDKFDEFDYNNDNYADKNIYDEDDSIGTEDISESIEEGIPYIPPTSSSYRKSLNSFKIKNNYDIL